MDSDKISYAGVAGAVAGIIGLFGIYANWWSSAGVGFDGTDDVSGALALSMSLGTFVFGGAYVLMSDPKIRRAMGALMTLTAVILTLACVWGLTRGDQVAVNASVDVGLWISVLGGVLGIAAGLLALRNAQEMDEVAPSSPDAPTAQPHDTSAMP
jgi:hypothetical protein